MARSEETVVVSYQLLVVSLLAIFVITLVGHGWLAGLWIQPTVSQSGFLSDLSKITQTILGALIGLLGGRAAR